MKVKLLVKLGELILGEAFSDEEGRADMYLPIWLLAFAVLLLFGAVVLAILACIDFSVGFLFGAFACAVLGVLALLCWRNQKIEVLSEDTFAYTTFLGNKTVYNFNDIKGLKANNDSLTLYVADGKVHIESCAQISERLAKKLNEQFKNIK